MSIEDTEDDDLYEPEKCRPSWQCDGCGEHDYKRALPKDRAKFYAKPYQPKCRKCGSDMSPSGY